MLEGEKPTEKEIDRVGGREREREEVGHGALFPLVRHPSISLSLSLSLSLHIVSTVTMENEKADRNIELLLN